VPAQVGPQLPGRRVEPAVLRAAKQREGRQQGGRVGRMAAAPREEDPVTLREAAVPALLLAAAPLLARAAARFRAPKPLQWLVGPASCPPQQSCPPASCAPAATPPRAPASGQL